MSHNVQKYILCISGVIILDFEKYQPDFNMAGRIYQEYSLIWAKSLFPTFPHKIQELIAEVGFQNSAQILFQVNCSDFHY